MGPLEKHCSKLRVISQQIYTANSCCVCHKPFLTILLSVLTHVAQICGNFDIANSSRYCTGFTPMLFQWSHSHMACFSSQICCNFFALDPFLSHDFCSVEKFLVLKLVALLFVLPFPCISKVGQIFFLLLEL